MMNVIRVKAGKTLSKEDIIGAFDVKKEELEVVDDNEGYNEVEEQVGNWWTSMFGRKEKASYETEEKASSETEENEVKELNVDRKAVMVCLPVK